MFVFGSVSILTAGYLKSLPIDSSYTPEVQQLALEKWWLEDYFPLGMAYFQGAMLNFQGVTSRYDQH